MEAVRWRVKRIESMSAMRFTPTYTAAMVIVSACTIGMSWLATESTRWVPTPG